MQKTMVLTGVICVTAGLVAGAQLGSIIKGGAVALAVDKFGPDINKGINSLYQYDKALVYPFNEIIAQIKSELA